MSRVESEEPHERVCELCDDVFFLDILIHEQRVWPLEPLFAPEGV